MLALSSSAIFGNRTLKDELAAHCRGSSTVIPTCVPAYRDRRKQHSEHWPVTIGWVGMRSNLIYLRELEPAFRSLAKEYKGRLRLHVSSSTDYRSEFLPTNFTVWSLQREDDVVASFDIGVMPLEDDFHSRGKCAFKAVLYMSRGIPPVISPVGLNTELVKNGWNGYLASTPEQWHVAISQLVEDHRLRARLGENAFETIEQGFSTQHAYPLLKQIFEGAIGGKQADHDMRVSSSNVSL
jgi:glycosyltransferase involved in cell wall biosynthesis